MGIGPCGRGERCHDEHPECNHHGARQRRRCPVRASRLGPTQRRVMRLLQTQLDYDGATEYGAPWRLRQRDLCRMLPVISRQRVIQAVTSLEQRGLVQVARYERPSGPPAETWVVLTDEGIARRIEPEPEPAAAGNDGEQAAG